MQTINKSATLYLEQQVTCKQSINQQLSIWSSMSRAKRKKQLSTYQRFSTYSSSSRSCANAHSLSSSLSMVTENAQTLILSAALYLMQQVMSEVPNYQQLSTFDNKSGANNLNLPAVLYLWQQVTNKVSIL